MPPKKDAKPQLHVSHLNMLGRCGVQFERVYIQGHREPPGVALLVGSATHAASARNLNHKIETKGTLLSLEEVKDTARDEMVRVWQESPVILNAEERERGLDRVRGDAVDEAVQLSALHASELAPVVQPVHVERSFVIEATGYPFDIAGQIDVDEGDSIRELKTRAKVPNPDEVHVMEQLTEYALGKKVIDGRFPKKVFLDALIKPTKTKPARLATFESTRGEEDALIFKNRFERAIEIIEKGAFAPANRTDWWCSARFCGFAADGSCKFFRANPVHAFIQKNSKPATPKQRTSEVRYGKRIIKAHSAEWHDAVR